MTDMLVTDMLVVALIATNVMWALAWADMRSSRDHYRWVSELYMGHYDRLVRRLVQRRKQG